MWTWPRCTTPPPSARSSNSSTSAWCPPARAGSRRNAARPRWAGGSRSTRPAGWSRAATRSARPGWPRCTSWSPSCGVAGPRQVEGARIAVAENGGGLIGLEEAAVAMTVLEAPDVASSARRTIRDGQQSLWGMRMRAGMALPGGPPARPHRLPGGSTLRAARCSRSWVQVTGREDPWEGPGPAARRDPAHPDARRDAGQRRGVVRRHAGRADGHVDAQAERARAALVLDLRLPLGWPKMARLARIAKEYGSEVAGTVFFSRSPGAHRRLLRRAGAEMAAVPEIDTILFYDTAGVARRRADAHARPRAAGRDRREALEFHSNNLMGTSGLAYVEAVKLGVRILHTASRPMANGRLGAVHRERRAQPRTDGPRAHHRHPSVGPGRRALPRPSARRPGSPSTRSASTTCSAPCTRSPAA